MHLIGVTGGTGHDAGGETVIRDGMHIGGTNFKMTLMAIHAANPFLIVLGIGEVHRHFLVAVDA